jgi:hypothetical protein
MENIKIKKELPPRCNNCDYEDDPQRTLVRTHSKYLLWKKTICPKHDCRITTADIIPGVSEDIALIELDKMVS